MIENNFATACNDIDENLFKDGYMLYRKYGFSETGIEDKCVVMRLDTL